MPKLTQEAFSPGSETRADVMPARVSAPGLNHHDDGSGRQVTDRKVISPRITRTTTMARKMKNRILAISAAPAEMPVKPKSPAIRAMIAKKIAQRSSAMLHPPLCSGRLNSGGRESAKQVPAD